MCRIYFYLILLMWATHQDLQNKFIFVHILLHLCLCACHSRSHFLFSVNVIFWVRVKSDIKIYSARRCERLTDPTQLVCSTHFFAHHSKNQYFSSSSSLLRVFLVFSVCYLNLMIFREFSLWCNNFISSYYFIIA